MTNEKKTIIIIKINKTNKILNSSFIYFFSVVFYHQEK